MKLKATYILFAFITLLSCGSQKNDNRKAPSEASTNESTMVKFNADSAYEYINRQVLFGPRVPNTESHRNCCEWLISELMRHGASVTRQDIKLTAFDGTILDATNIIGSFNPEASDRLLLLAHWDCRPWADADPDPANHSTSVDGANDGASGVGVLLEISRQLGENSIKKGIDILFVDAEDWGAEGDDESWALGSRYFANNPHKEGYSPQQAILLDMVGGHNAKFRKEYFSIQNAPSLVDKIWSVALQSGYENYFLPEIGGAVTDDHIELQKVGIRAINIIEFDPTDGFNPAWHTINDNMSVISKETLKAVGQTVLNYIYERAE